MGGDPVRLFGTVEAPGAGKLIEAGPLTLELIGGSLRDIRWQGIELIRVVDYPIRDGGWGTCPLVTIDESLKENADGWRYLRVLETADGRLAGRFVVTGAKTGRLDVKLSLTGVEDFETNRAGFAVLHPITDLHGSALGVVHSVGSREALVFPDKISPGQPVFDIQQLIYDVAGVRAEISFEGEIFEMEDQRNWSDASYKTYCRPMAKPLPYFIRQGETVRQKISVRFSGDGSAGADKTDFDLQVRKLDATPMPTVALAVAGGWIPKGEELDKIKSMGAGHLVGRLAADDLATLGLFAELGTQLGSVVDLEVIVADDQGEMDCSLEVMAAECERLGLNPGRVMALPEAYLKSYQPDGVWPVGASPRDALLAARKAFPKALIGGGSLTNFTEFNRHPPASSHCDFVSHGSTAIVHAADDRSVLETLETLPMIFDSARAYAPDAAYCLGLVAIGMRSNPYGQSVVANPDQVRREMAIAEPRQRGLFAAAWMVGVAGATFGCAVEQIQLAAPVGPFGLVYRKEEWPQPLFDEDRARVVYPAFHVARALFLMAGRQRRQLSLPEGCHGVAAEFDGLLRILVANCTGEVRRVSLPSSAEIHLLDTTSFDEATRDGLWLDNSPAHKTKDIELGPFAVAFIALGAE